MTAVHAMEVIAGGIEKAMIETANEEGLAGDTPVKYAVLSCVRWIRKAAAELRGDA